MFGSLVRGPPLHRRSRSFSTMEALLRRSPFADEVDAEALGSSPVQGMVSGVPINATVARIESEVVRKGVARVAGVERDYEIDDEPVTVGRDPACHIVLDDAEVSAVHLELIAHPRGIR